MTRTECCPLPSPARASLAYPAAQLAAWDGTVGWFFWSYKLLVDGSNLDGWDLRKSIELGYLPEPFGR